MLVVRSCVGKVCVGSFDQLIYSCVGQERMRVRAIGEGGRVRRPGADGRVGGLDGTVRMQQMMRRSGEKDGESKCQVAKPRGVGLQPG